MVKKLLVIAGGVIVGVVVLSRRDSHQSEPAPAPVATPAATKPKQPPVIGTAMMMLKRSLNDSASAEFPTEDWAAEQIGLDRWRVRGEVVAANGFNARIRQPFMMEMTVDGDDMRVTFCKIGEQVIVDVGGH